MGLLFGTDGIRGVAGTPPLDVNTIFRAGHCLTRYLKTGHEQPRILIARDTRESGPWIERTLIKAITEAGGTARACEVLSTPAVSFLTTKLDAQAGIMISASHNPYQDNGIKIFAGDGMKFNDAVEDELEAEILRSAHIPPAGFRAIESRVGSPVFESVPEYVQLYKQHLRECVGNSFSLKGTKLILDCANGSQAGIAPDFFRSLGADPVVIHSKPDGRNINLNAGALHPDALKREVRTRGADLGIAFDGDADRAIFVDTDGTTRDGDDVLYLLARYSDPGDAPRIVVGTVMSNLGLEVALEKIGFRLLRTSVGDRYVLEEMLRSGAAFGGEQSGHVIFARLTRTGDGLLTAIKVLEILRKQNASISQLCSPVKRYPQVLNNVPVREKIPLEHIPGLLEAETACKGMLGRHSRILLRYSGTEKLARIMVEGLETSTVNEAARYLASFFEQPKSRSNDE